MIIFVGDEPSPRMKPGAEPFEGAACEPRLKEWISYLSINNESVAIINKYDVGAYAELFEYARYVALGNEAAKELKDFGLQHFKLPHPSGRNRQINDKKFIEQKLKECKEWIINSK